MKGKIILSNVFYLLGARGSMKDEVISKYEELYGNDKIEIKAVNPSWLSNLRLDTENYVTNDIPNDNANIIYLYTPAYIQEQTLKDKDNLNFAEALNITCDDLYRLRYVPNRVHIINYDVSVIRMVEKLNDYITNCNAKEGINNQA